MEVPEDGKEVHVLLIQPQRWEYRYEKVDFPMRELWDANFDFLQYVDWHRSSLLNLPLIDFLL